MKVLCWLGVHHTREPLRFEGEIINCKWCGADVARVWNDRTLKMKRLHLLLADQSDDQHSRFNAEPKPKTPLTVVR